MYLVFPVKVAIRRALAGALPVPAMLAAGIALSACTASMPASQVASLTAATYSPVVALPTDLNSDLRGLPSPARRVQVSVYDFPDLTGQYKDSDTFQTLSKAVSQGGASMLIKALQDAGDGSWFTVLDRAALNDLLKERQIVTEMRRQYRGEQSVSPSVLPPLAYSGIVLEGGIIGYDTNTLTGGAGANFLGIGGNTKWVQDTITVTLRAVSIKTSEVLASVTVSKVIASVSVDGNVFRYVQMDQLLQAEAGLTRNEPKQIALQAAVEKAVMSLIMEGVRLKQWSFSDPVAGNALEQKYLVEKYGKLEDAPSPTLPATQNAALVTPTVSIVRRPQPAPKVTVKTVPPTKDGQPTGPLPPPSNGDEVLN